MTTAALRAVVGYVRGSAGRDTRRLTDWVVCWARS